MVRWTVDDKEDWGREEEIEEDHRKIKELVSRKCSNHRREEFTLYPSVITKS